MLTASDHGCVISVNICYICYISVCCFAHYNMALVWQCVDVLPIKQMTQQREGAREKGRKRGEREREERL